MYMCTFISVVKCTCISCNLVACVCGNKLEDWTLNLIYKSFIIIVIIIINFPMNSYVADTH